MLEAPEARLTARQRVTFTDLEWAINGVTRDKSRCASFHLPISSAIEPKVMPTVFDAVLDGATRPVHVLPLAMDNDEERSAHPLASTLEINNRWKVSAPAAPT